MHMLTICTLIVFAVLIAGISVSWTRRKGAQWVPTKLNTVHKMLTIAGVGPGDVVYDPGCGDGRLIITAAQHYGARAVGIEIDPLRYVLCQILITVLGLRRQVKIIFGDFFKQDYQDADVIACYLLPGTIDNLTGKFKDELRPGSRIVTNTFKFADFTMTDCNDEVILYTV
jgi:ribosomal protein L11 methylase PrmA